MFELRVVEISILHQLEILYAYTQKRSTQTLSLKKYTLKEEMSLHKGEIVILPSLVFLKNSYFH